MRISPHMTSEIRRIDLPGRRTHLDEMTSVFQYYGLLQSTARARLSLTTALYRHSNIYIQFAGKSYGQTQKARSKAVFDGDLGKSGSQSAGRDSFQKLVRVALGNAGLTASHLMRRLRTGEISYSDFFKESEKLSLEELESLTRLLIE